MSYGSRKNSSLTVPHNAERLAISMAREHRFDSIDGLCAVEQLLQTKEDSRDPELQFAVLCALSSVDPKPLPRRIRERYVKAVTAFLLSGRTEKASEYWMAGDLLGAHWRSSRTTTRLFGLLTQARGEAAVLGILHGLEMQYRRLQSTRARRRLLAKWLCFNNAFRLTQARRISRRRLQILMRFDPEYPQEVRPR